MERRIKAVFKTKKKALTKKANANKEIHQASKPNENKQASSKGHPHIEKIQ